MTADRHSLDQVQRWMQAVLTHPDGVLDGLASAEAVAALPIGPDDVEQVVARSRAMTSEERLNVYAQAYVLRLIGCLEEEFPALRSAVGEAAFGQFARAYLRQYPSRSYTLAELSRDFPLFLERERPQRETADEAPDWADFLVDVARLERLYAEVFDGPGAERLTLLTPADLAAVSPEVWPGCRLAAAPCVQTIELRFPVHEYVTAVRRNDPAPELPAAAATCLVVTRRQYVVRRFPVSPAQFAVVQALLAGGTVAEAILAGADVFDGDLDAYAAGLRNWFAEWCREQLFWKVEQPPASETSSGS